MDTQVSAVQGSGGEVSCMGRAHHGGFLVALSHLEDVLTFFFRYFMSPCVIQRTSL